MRASTKENGIIAGFIAVLPSLIQIIASLSESVKSLLNLEAYLLVPNALHFLNFISFVFSLLFISLISLFESNPKYFIHPREARDANARQVETAAEGEGQNANRQISNDGMLNHRNLPKRRLYWSLGITAMLSLLAFFWTVVLKISGVQSGAYLVFLQGISYVLLLSSIAGIVFAATRAYIEKNRQFKPEEFLTNFEKTLWQYGVLQPSSFQVVQNELKQHAQRLVTCLIDGRREQFLVSYDGKEIIVSSIGAVQAQPTAT